MPGPEEKTESAVVAAIEGQVDLVKRFRIGSFMGGGALGAAVSGPLSAWFARREAFDTLEWFGKNGLQGFLLFLFFLLCGFSVYCLRELKRIEAARLQDVVTAKVESQALLREQIAVLPTLTVALVESNDLKRRLVRLLDELKKRIVFEDGTPFDGVPTEEKKK